MIDPSWDLVVAGPAKRSIERLPAKVAVAVVEFLVGPLVVNSHRVGKALRNDLFGLHSTRVGMFRIVYEIGDDNTIRVLYIDHRGDVYRPR